jgi:flavocytochrome c
MILWPKVEKWDYKTEVVIVGAGIAGLLASIEAYDKGVKVILIEKNKSPYQNASTLCGGNMAIPNWRQEKEKINDSKKLLCEDMKKTGLYSNEPAVLRLFINNVEKAYNRLTSYGIKSTGLTYQGGHSVKRSLGHKSYDVMKKLYEEVKSRNIKILFNSKLTYLIRNLEANQVVGTGVRNGPNNYHIKSLCTILATGGIAGNLQLIDRYVPKLRNYVLIDMRNKNSSGEGHLNAMNIGADTSHMHVVTTYASGIPVNGREGLTFFTNSGIKVNKEGKRFVNEITTAPCQIGEKVLDQPDRTVYQIVDYNIWKNDNVYWGGDYGKGPEVYNRMKKLIKNPPIYFGNTVDKLAFNSGINKESLKDTIQKYNQYCRKGVDPEFNRPSKTLVSIKKPPFVAIRLILIATHGCGGLRTNSNLEVVDVFGKEIKGLFACGEIVGGVSGEVYLTATHYPVAMTFGYLAGNFAAIRAIEQS